MASDLEVFSARLAEALEPDAGPLPRNVAERLYALDQLVSQWGRAIRLIGFKDPVTRHRRYFAEALAVLPWLPDEGRALDIGSGGGSPALPLAIARPAVAWTLVEANERKALFLEQAARTLELNNVTVVHSRYESAPPTQPSDIVTVRGVAVGKDMLTRVASELGPNGRFLWISSQKVLSVARERLEGSWARCTGPLPLLSDGAFLLAADVGR